MSSAQDEADEIRKTQDQVIAAHKRAIVEHIVNTDQPGKEDW